MYHVGGGYVACLADSMKPGDEGRSFQVLSLCENADGKLRHLLDEMLTCLEGLP